MKEGGEGDVNFGLLTLFWDQALGTFHYEDRPPLSSAELGIAKEPSYPQAYTAQILRPFLGGCVATELAAEHFDSSLSVRL